MNKEEAQELVAFAQYLLERTTNEIFSDLEKITLQGIISDRSYEQITSDKSIKFTPDYLRQTISPKLRRKLTAALKKVGVVDPNTKTILKKEIVPKLRQALLREYPGEFASDGYSQPDDIGNPGKGNQPMTTGFTQPLLPQLLLLRGGQRAMGNFFPPQRIYQNLPTRDRTTFIGHEKQLNRLLKLLSWDSRIHRISVEGIGGAGKTTLIVEAAYAFLESAESPNFDAMIFTSAKPHRLTGTGILPWLKKENIAVLNDL